MCNHGRKINQKLRTREAQSKILPKGTMATIVD